MPCEGTFLFIEYIHTVLYIPYVFTVLFKGKSKGPIIGELIKSIFYKEVHKYLGGGKNCTQLRPVSTLFQGVIS